MTPPYGRKRRIKEPLTWKSMKEEIEKVCLKLTI